MHFAILKTSVNNKHVSNQARGHYTAYVRQENQGKGKQLQVKSRNEM